MTSIYFIPLKGLLNIGQCFKVYHTQATPERSSSDKLTFKMFSIYIRPLKCLKGVDRLKIDLDRYDLKGLLQIEDFKEASKHIKPLICHIQVKGILKKEKPLKVN